MPVEEGTMSIAATRLTLFAIISSIEEDLRALVRNEIPPAADARVILGQDLHSRACSRLAKDVDSDYGEGLYDLLHYTDFTDVCQIVNRNKAIIPKGIVDYVQSVTPYLAPLAPIRNRVVHSRPLHSSDFPTTWDLSTALIDAQPRIWSQLKATLQKLTSNPSHVLAGSIPAFEAQDETRSHNLPIPDFDETGFIGRRDLLTQLTRHCLGPYPVITLVGEGGIGKTAIALQTAYALLDLPDTPFEAIIWASCKTTQLTATSIREIDGAIKDSLGLFESLTEHLAGTSTPDPVAEILQYLEQFKVLLLLDNLETVLDDRIKSFLERIPAGTKILITSRIGLGAFEFPVKIGPMAEPEAVELLRSVARMRGVGQLTAFDNKKLAAFCRRMANNPAYIKWFVTAVQVGKSPGEVLANPDMFLEFCMSNVYRYLSSIGKDILHTMQGVPGKHSLAELAFLCGEREPIPMQKGLHELLATNMVNMSSIPRGSSFESRYSVGELAQAYLGKHHPLAPDEAKLLLSRRRELASSAQEVEAQLHQDPYSFYAISIRSKSDLILAKLEFRTFTTE
jgi:hypothetical protein